MPSARGKLAIAPDGCNGLGCLKEAMGYQQ